MIDNRLLKINGVIVDLDDETAIGIDLQSYNIKKPGQKHINVSNSFTVPPTAKNLAIFGTPNDPQSTSTKVYDINYCNYWVDNDQLITNSKVRVQGIQERIELFIYEKADFWTQTKKDSWPDFIVEFLAWMASEKGLPIQGSPASGSPDDFLQSYMDSSEGVVLPFFLGNLYNYQNIGQKSKYYFDIVRDTFDPNTLIGVDLIDSDYINNGNNLRVNIEASTSYDEVIWAGEVATGLNSDSRFSDFYTAVSDGNRVYIDSNEGIIDPDFYITAIGACIVETTSTKTQDGLGKISGNLEIINPDSYTVFGRIYLRYTTASENSLGGHFCVFAKTLFEFIEYKYDVDFLTPGGVLPGNIWDDPVGQALYMPIRDLAVILEPDNNYFKIESEFFNPLTSQKDKAGKTVFDFINSFMQVMNIVKDEFANYSKHTIRLARFDDIENLAEVIDYSDKLDADVLPKTIPFIEDYAQVNRLKFKEVYPEGDELVNSKTLTCNNLNLDAEADILEIDAYVPSVVISHGEAALNMMDKESFKTFTWMLSKPSTTILATVSYWYMPGGSLSEIKYIGGVFNMPIAQLYDLNSEYNFLDEVITYPRVVEVGKWLTIDDIRNFEFFKQYFIRQLNGSFFINKIKGFNPKSKQSTTLELIKISNKTPITPPTADPWIDGVGLPWLAGDGSYWF